MPIFKTCCCGLSLKTGTIVIGCLSLISSIAYLILVVVLTTQNYPNFKEEFMRTIYEAKLISVLTAAAVGCVVSTSLLVGAVKGNMWLLLPYIVLVPIGLLLTFINAIYSAVVLSTHVEATGVFVSLAINFGVITLNIFLLLIVISYFQTLKDEKLNGGSNVKNIYAAAAPWANAETHVVITNEKS